MSKLDKRNVLSKTEADILLALKKEPFISQRVLSETAGHSLGNINQAIKSLIQQGYLSNQIQLTSKAFLELEAKRPQNAVILAAGYGMRMLPIGMETTKGLLEVYGEPLIERLIRQLQEMEIREIYVVVGFMKEKYEYLIDEFHVKLVVNEDYAKKNNLYSLKCVLDHISNTYILPCDVWCRKNPFNRYELYSWYMVSDLTDDESDVRVNRKMELVKEKKGNGANQMIGISYLVEDTAFEVRKRVEQLCQNSRNMDSFWENALYDQDHMIVMARVVHANDVVEINTYEQLRELDMDSRQLKSEALNIISKSLGVKISEIININILKKGMTNRSFVFEVNRKKYIMRIPGEGTEQLINRMNEASVYRVITGKGLCDEPIYINPINGYKIMAYLENVRVCNINDEEDLRRCMKKLREFHEMHLTVEHEFDLYRQIEFYESLWNGQGSIYKDYEKTKEKVYSLQWFIKEHTSTWTLTHIDAVPDNFLFYREGEDEKLQLTDWEYAGMQDPHVDLAMFSIYSLFDKRQVDHLLDIYFEHSCDIVTRTKIYCYVAVCGLLWSNWCEYKRQCGVEFGEYSLRQYRYAKEYYQYAMKEIELL